jgi:hypothetical protein
VTIELLFEPAVAWGGENPYDVTGTLNGHRVRGKLAPRAGGYASSLARRGVGT